MQRLLSVAVMAAVVVVAGCAGGGGEGSGQKFTALNAGTCKAKQNEISRMAANGIAGKIAAVQSGRKVSAETRAQVAKYDQMLEEYLGAGCHTH